MKSKGRTRQPLIVDIEGNSLADGPGIRSVVFFKGCSLNCSWCQNPECKSIAAELWWDREKCIGDGECIKVCPQGAISRDNFFFIDRDICKLCFKCAEVCPAKAIRRVGHEMSVDEIVRKVVSYKPFFDTSGGGVTLSGGEPMLPLEFTSVLLRRFKEEGVHTLLETAGMFDIKKFESLIIPHIDMIFFDIKFIDSLEHEHYCGVRNERILDNFISLNKKSMSGEFVLMPRTPLIPDVTDTEKNICDIAEFYKRYMVPKTVFLPNNPASISKLMKLGQRARFGGSSPVRKLYSEEKEKKIKEKYFEQGIQVNFG